MSAARARDIESVHIVARGMMLGNVERLEIVVRRFDFGAGDDAEADGGEDAQKFVVGLADQVARADRALDAGEREVNFVAGCGALFHRCFLFSRERSDSCFYVRLQRVETLADGGFDLFGCRLQPVLGNLGKNSRLAAQPLYSRDAQINRINILSSVAIECRAQLTEKGCNLVS